MCLMFFYISYEILKKLKNDENKFEMIEFRVKKDLILSLNSRI